VVILELHHHVVIEAIQATEVIEVTEVIKKIKENL